MRTVHNILHVDKDGLISFNDFLLFSEGFKSLGHLDEQQAKEFTDIIKAVNKDKSGFISVKQFKLIFQCLGRSNEHVAVAFAVIDVNGDGKLSLKEFVKLGKEFYYTKDNKQVSKMLWREISNYICTRFY